MTINLAKEVAELKEELIAVRRDLHMHPELAFEEYRTADIVARHLGSLGYQVQRGVARTGVVGLLDTGRAGKTLMLRADMDALPIQEVEGRPYGSAVPGKMHACGHDGHTAASMAVAAILARHRQRLSGRVKVVFQPAEEIVAGAKAMVEAGVLRDPAPDGVLGFHFWASLEAGRVGVHQGVMWASVDQFRLHILGVGAHGGTPHLGADPLLAGAHLVVALQELFSREVTTFQPALFTQGIFQAGTLYNVIPSDAQIWGSCRTMDEQVREFLHRRIREVTEAVAATFRCRGSAQVLTGSPAVQNDPQVSALVREAATQAVGSQNVVDPGQSMVGDDVSYFLRQVPGCYFLVGIANPDKGTGAPHHSPEFDIDETALPIAAETMARAAIAFLS